MSARSFTFLAIGMLTGLLVYHAVLIGQLHDEVSHLSHEVAALQAARPAAATPAGVTPTGLTPCNPSPGTLADGSPAPACAGWQDTNTTTVDQDLLITDHTGAPEFWVSNAGGTWAGNDMLGITGKSVFSRVAYFTPSPDGLHGWLVLDGHVLTGRELAQLLRLIGR